MKTINVEQEIIAKNREVLLREDVSLAEQQKLDAQIDRIRLSAESKYYKEKDALLADLGFDYKLAEAQRIRQERETFAHLPQDRIMSLEAIKATCLQYGLRFLPTRFYKGALDEQIGAKLEEFRTMNRGELPTVGEPEQMQGGGKAPGPTQFYIAAPSESFILQPIPRDPLLFCRLNLKKFFLLHKWGGDLSDKDTKNHGIHEGNWNSRFEEKDVMNGDYHRAIVAHQQILGAGTQTFTATFANNMGSWMQAVPSITTGSGSLLNSSFIVGS